MSIAVLSVVLTMVQTGNMTPNVIDIILLILKILGIFAALLIGTIFIIPRTVNSERLWKARGSVEGIDYELKQLSAFIPTATVIVFLISLVLFYNILKYLR